MNEAIDPGKCIKNLCQVELFEGLDESQLLAISNLCELQVRLRGDYLMREGEEAHGMYVLLLGEVSVSKKIKLPHLEHSDPEERILSRITAENRPALGETSLIGERLRSATVCCNNDCMFYRIDSLGLLDLCSQDPRIGDHVFQRLSRMLYKRLKQASTDVVKLTAALVYALEE